MIRNKKAMLFCSQMILTGALITGAPCLAYGDNGETERIFGSSDTNAEDEVSDHSGEGQIHKPASLKRRILPQIRILWMIPPTILMVITRSWGRQPFPWHR